MFNAKYAKIITITLIIVKFKIINQLNKNLFMTIIIYLNSIGIAVIKGIIFYFNICILL